MNDRIIAFFTETTLFGISILNLLVALTVATVVFLVARAAISFLIRRVRRWSEHEGPLSQIMAKVLSGTSNSVLVFGRDGKMATYAALVLVQGTVGWWLHRKR